MQFRWGGPVLEGGAYHPCGGGHLFSRPSMRRARGLPAGLWLTVLRVLIGLWVRRVVLARRPAVGWVWQGCGGRAGGLTDGLAQGAFGLKVARKKGRMSAR